MSRSEDDHPNLIADAEILRVLAEKIPGELLKGYFPDQPPATIRKQLYKLAMKFSDGEAGKKPPARQPAGQKSRISAKKIILFTDGAARGNPGEAGAGMQALDDSGRELLVKGVYLGHCTNNVAEYKALLLGLDEAKALGAREVELNLDSELIVRQIQGAYRVKDSKLIPLFAKTKTLLADFDAYTIRHVPRAENQRADQMANAGIDKKNTVFGVGA